MKRLGRRRRAVALTFLLFGLLTFFEPLIKTNPPVVGRWRWSVLDLVRWTYQPKSFPFADILRDDRFGNRTLHGVGYFWTEFGSIYPIILFAITSVCFFPRQELLAVTALAGTLASFGNLQYSDHGNIGLQLLLYGDFKDGRVTSSALWLALLLTMGVVTFVSLHETLDGDMR